MNDCRHKNLNLTFERFGYSLIFLAQNDHQLKIDKNDRNDAEHLSFLLFADILVSDDEKYMKKAFDLLYKGTNKRILKLDQFLSFIDSIN